MAKISGKRKIYEMINNRITSLLEKGDIPWRKPWISGEPVNFITKKPYRGINPFILISSGFSCPFWVSFKQAHEKGGKIKKGENGLPVVFWKWITVDDPDSVSGKKGIPFLRFYTVFNLEQTEGIEIPETKAREFNPIAEAEKVIFGMRDGPLIESNESQAYYRPSDDVVNIPKATLFGSDEGYYSTLFHELIHSTGHIKRLNREGIANTSHFGSHDYSKEELVAEMGSAFLCGHCGIEPQVIQNQAAYIQHWLKKLHSNKKWLVYAAAAAQKAADHILNIENDADSLPGGNRTGNSENVTPSGEKGVTP